MCTSNKYRRIAPKRQYGDIFIGRIAKSVKKAVKRQIVPYLYFKFFLTFALLLILHKAADHIFVHFLLILICHCAICTNFYLKFLLDNYSISCAPHKQWLARLASAQPQCLCTFHGLRARNVSKYHALRALCKMHKK